LLSLPHADAEVLKVLLVVELLKRVQFTVEGLPVGQDLVVRVWLEREVDRPAAVDEAHVPQLDTRLVAHRTGDRLQLLVEFKCVVTAWNHHELLVRFAPRIDAVGEPVESVLHLTVPRRLFLPLDLHDLTQLVESEVHPH
jgi:hypothetical protein